MISHNYIPYPKSVSELNDKSRYELKFLIRSANILIINNKNIFCYLIFNYTFAMQKLIMQQRSINIEIMAGDRRNVKRSGGSIFDS